jgi:hypothetical protein
MIQSRTLSITLALVVTLARVASGAPSHKLDAALQAAATGECEGTQSVIVRTKPGARDGLRKSLISHGRHVQGEFPALDAMVVEVDCDDLNTLAKLESTVSISGNHP